MIVDSSLVGVDTGRGWADRLRFSNGDVSFPLSMEALGHAVGEDDDGPFTLDARRRWCGVRAG
jgi:hypothetical protein